MFVFNDVGTALRIADVTQQAVREQDIRIPIGDKSLTVAWLAEPHPKSAWAAIAEKCTFVGDLKQLEQEWLDRGEDYRFRYTTSGDFVYLLIKGKGGYPSFRFTLPVGEPSS